MSCSRLIAKMRQWISDQTGATAIEYGLIAALTIVVMLVGLTAFGNATTNMFNNIATAVTGATR